MRNSLHTTLLVGLAGVLSLATACGDDTTATTSGLGGAGGSGDGGADGTTSSQASTSSNSASATVTASSGSPTSSQSSSTASTSSGEGGEGGIGQGGNPTGGGEGGIGQGGNPAGGGEGGIGQGGNPAGGGEGGASVVSSSASVVVSSSSGGNDCLPLSFTGITYDADNSAYVGGVAPALGGAGDDFGVIVFNHVAQTLALSTTDPTDPAADQFVFAGEDFDDVNGGYAAAYWATEGSLVVAQNGWSLDNVVLSEIDPTTGEFVAGGTCYNLADASGALGEPLVPAEWVCDPGFYGADDGCDCGCGALDTDCADDLVASCEFCSEDSCANDGTLFGCNDLVIDPDDNYLCTGGSSVSSSSVASSGSGGGGWTCDPAFLGADDGCDCGCGIVDTDCPNDLDTSCDFCSADSCGNDGTLFGCDLALIDNDDNNLCVSGSTSSVATTSTGGGGWTCDPAFLGADDGCDCGCGILDTDCANDLDTSCDFCSGDSCGNDGTLFGCDLALIDNDDNFQCL